MDVSKFLKSKWLHGADLPQGQSVILTIKAVSEHALEDGTSKPKLDFYESDQSLLCNKSQTKALAGLYGLDARAWVGQRIELLAVPSAFEGKPSILIRQGQPAIAQPAAGNGHYTAQGTGPDVQFTR